MTDPVDPVVFLRGFLEEFLENQLVNGFLPTERYQRLVSDLRRDPKLASIGRRLFKVSPKPVLVEGYGKLRIIHLRELENGEFPFLQGLTQESSRKRQLSCFIGHRFLRDIESSLRFNLVHLFEPHAITLKWVGADLNADDIFAKILAEIRRADLCLFDNIATLNKPNVYIEIGMESLARSSTQASPPILRRTKASTIKDYLQVRQEGGREVTWNLRHYRLQAILTVGYETRSTRRPKP